MGMFGDLDNLSKRQQAASVRQQPDSEVPPPDSSPPITPKPAKSITKQTKIPAARKTQPSAEATTQDTLLSNNHAPSPMSVRSDVRTKIRHSFDIFQDQLFALRDLAHERERGSVKKVPLGDLVQESLDMYLAAQRRSK